MTDLEVSRMSKDSLFKTVEGVVFFAGTPCCGGVESFVTVLPQCC